MLRSLLIKLIIHLGLRQEQRFLRLLAKLEYGVGVFCLKLSEKARDEEYDNLATLLESHGKEEIKHGKMLASLCDGRQRIEARGNIRWLSFRNDAGEELAQHPDPLTQGTPIQLEHEGEAIAASFENLDGLSNRYFSLRLLFQGLDAASYSWSDRLAFMIVLESETKKFYHHLGQATRSVPLNAIALSISNDEENHAEYLRYALFYFSHFPRDEIDKWASRLNWARWGLVVDVWRFLVWT